MIRVGDRVTHPDWDGAVHTVTEMPAMRRGFDAMCVFEDGGFRYASQLTVVAEPDDGNEETLP